MINNSQNKAVQNEPEKRHVVGFHCTDLLCPYCNQPVKLVTGKDIYPHRKDLYSKKFYSCKPCDAHVGCHDGTDKPLGRLANKELRIAKMQAHAAFDPLWKQGHFQRKEAYRWLAENLGIKEQNCHIGEFDVVTCKRVVFLGLWAMNCVRT